MNSITGIAAFAPAFVKAQAQIKHAIKDSTNPHLRSKYADLGSVWDACRSALHDNGIAVVQCPASDGTNVSVTTTLLHTSGESISSTLSLAPTKADPQGVGSAITYARRYALAAMVGVTADDDDGEAASRGTRSATQAPPPPVAHPQAGGQAAPAAETPAPVKTKVLTADQRWRSVTALLRQKLSAPIADKFIAEATAKYADEGGKVAGEKRELLLVDLETAAAGKATP